MNMGLDTNKLDDIDFGVIRTNKKKEYINLEVAFDIESTSTYLADGQKVSFMYFWTMGIKDENLIFHGRTWEDFLKVCGQLKEYYKLSEDRILTCYVHNLSYEFQFMRNYFEWTNVFSIDERKPIKALSSFGIEFKDSYILSGFALSKLADNLMSHTIQKLEGDLDYELVRHSETTMTDEELQYCINDVVIILNYLTEQLELYETIDKIPLTNTGRVRQYVKHECYYTSKNHRKSSGGKFKRYRQIMEDLQLEKSEYVMLKRAFMGGFTHANANKSSQVIDDVTSIDFSSSYPSAMLSEKFPMGKAIETTFTKDKDFDYYRKRYCLVFNVKFTNITSKFQHENYLSESKCISVTNPVLNNGRIFSADEIITTITDVDFEIMEQAYNWDSVEVNEVYRYHKSYLPKDIIKSVIKLYADKTTLKDVEGSEVEYVLSKGMLNSVYGMCVTDIIRDDIIYSDDWGVEPADVDEQIQKYNESYNRFLYYPWGVWITAYSRRNLWTGIISIGDDYIYSDTDAIKFTNYDKHKPYINRYNQMLKQKLNAMCDFHSLDYKDLEPETKDGIKKPMGVWELDGNYKRFKTLGAKRYLVEHQNNQLELTVSGLSKQNGIRYLERIHKDNTEIFDNFNDELYIPVDETGKMTHTYIDVPYKFMIQDYNGVESEVDVLSSVHLEKCDFTLSITKQYINFINEYAKGYVYKGMKTV